MAGVYRPTTAFQNTYGPAPTATQAAMIANRYRPPGGWGGVTTSTTASSYSAPKKPEIETPLEGKLVDALNKPGMSQETVDNMVNQGKQSLANREAENLRAASLSATASGFGRAGAMQSGQDSIRSDFAGQRSDMETTVRQAAEQDRLNRQSTAINQATSYLAQLKGDARADARLNQDFAGQADAQNALTMTAQRDRKASSGWVQDPQPTVARPAMRIGAPKLGKPVAGFGITQYNPTYNPNTTFSKYANPNAVAGFERNNMPYQKYTPNDFVRRK